ncbi:MAG: iron ABC transporter substrate-binding protein, partial [Rhodospirillales bacterium CG15_BIG_FIL_POST_REV_8_21_14_020_66_15]
MPHTKRLLAAVTAAAVTAVASAAAVQAADKEVNLYSYRQPFLIKPLLDAFTKETGIKVNVVFAKKGMLEKIKAAGDNSPADAVLTVDIGRLYALKEAGVLQSVKSETLEKNIPAHFRDPEGQWFGLTARARVALVSKERVKPGDLTSYEDLAKPEFKGRICTRSGKHAYNVALIASMIAHHGEEGAEKWLKGVKANLARKPQGNDRAQAKAVFEGVCDVAISNNYYMGKM